ncbi:MAG: acylphosphatase [Deltaproteobacteria bacterium]|nr:acylphosphatase [Deltaproteobacteria bacterium]
MATTRAHAIVKGWVQGVFFRAKTSEEAFRLGVTGWVRNLNNGDVEAVIEGEIKAVEALVAWLHRGPSRAQVTDVNVDWSAATGEFKNFNTRY